MKKRREDVLLRLSCAGILTGVMASDPRLRRGGYVLNEQPGARGSRQRGPESPGTRRTL